MCMADSHWNKTNFFITTQHLLERKKQSLLAILGVVFGVATFIVLLSFMTGVNDFLDDAVFKGNPDLVISPDASTKEQGISVQTVPSLANPLELQSKVVELPNVEAVSKQLLVPGIIAGKNQNLPVQLHGINPKEERLMVSRRCAMQFQKDRKSPRSRTPCTNRFPSCPRIQPGSANRRRPRYQ